jgi:hypothetical protein
MKHPVLKWVFMVSWLISALATINVGLAPFGFDFFRTEFAMMNLYNLMAPIHYVILASGLISLALFVMSLSGTCGCGSSNGKRSK